MILRLVAVIETQKVANGVEIDMVWVDVYNVRKVQILAFSNCGIVVKVNLLL